MPLDLNLNSAAPCGEGCDVLAWLWRRPRWSPGGLEIELNPTLLRGTASLATEWAKADRIELRSWKTRFPGEGLTEASALKSGQALGSTREQDSFRARRSQLVRAPHPCTAPQPRRLGAPCPWNPGELELGREHCSGAVLDIQDSTSCDISSNSWRSSQPRKSVAMLLPGCTGSQRFVRAVSPDA